MYAELLSLLRQYISETNADDHLYNGRLVNDEFKFSKRDVSLNIKSELVFIGRIIRTEERIILEIKGRYKIIPMLGYLAFIALFSIPLWSIENPLMIVLPLMPYTVMVVKIKIRAREVLNDFQRLLN